MQRLQSGFLAEMLMLFMDQTEAVDGEGGTEEGRTAFLRPKRCSLSALPVQTPSILASTESNSAPHPSPSLRPLDTLVRVVGAGKLWC